MSEVIPRINARTLVITDGVFEKQCTDAKQYVSDLKAKLALSTTRDIEVVSITTNRGICDLDVTIPALDMDAKNKTTFVQSLENSALLFDEMLIIKNSDDPFLSSAYQCVTSLGKPIYVYGYVRK